VALARTPDFAVKVFTSCQKSAWSNEKDIYSALSSTHLNILKFYGSDTFEPPSSATSEYWLITEYHPCGSLYDLLKASWLTWPQLVRIIHSFLEGLVYLHSEDAGIGKNFTIAHRDLKSKNVMVRRDGQSCCIGDFGLALEIDIDPEAFKSKIRSKVENIDFLKGF
jgi:serine/threonine protein kinase